VEQCRNSNLTNLGNRELGGRDINRGRKKKTLSSQGAKRGSPGVVRAREGKRDVIKREGGEEEAGRKVGGVRGKKKQGDWTSHTRKRVRSLGQELQSRGF